ncbi:MFS transporter [Pseudolysinimonas kribbensis]|uniref:MFS-type transporter YddS n=1 Tax=Pseudolysinimonas kribbensis TaxID=433641 RepID=A0ABQ6K5S0_9MICO|nr:MFS transporter [Pseudolysinimonas kribbensis]GMA94131.1 putative MFS-type transporter YddS [Pseudolysinimonas kribbensis]
MSERVDRARLHRRVRVSLIIGQAMAGVGMGGTLSAGSLLIAHVTGSDAWAGMAATLTTLGAAAAALPLAALARRHGRAPALTTGGVVAAAGAALGVLAAVLGSVAPLFIAMVLIGVGTAVNLQSRFAATDLSDPRSRARDLAIVVWATTVGAVLGPNLIDPADRFGQGIGLPPLAGPFLVTLLAQLLAAVVYVIGIRPDPLRFAARAAAAAGPAAAGSPPDRNGVTTGIVALAASHATMVSVMSMTPVHIQELGGGLVVIGFTISLHVAGMYGLSPVFGILADRVGRERAILVGQGLLLLSLVCVGAGARSEALVMLGLVLLGLGWSASTVAAAALVSESAAPERRTSVQGRSDLIMSASGAVGGALAGVAVATLGYAALAFIALALVFAVLATVGFRAGRGRREQPLAGAAAAELIPLDPDVIREELP